MAIRQNPNISVGKLLALAQHQVVRQARSADLPTLTGNITAQSMPRTAPVSPPGLRSRIPRLLPSMRAREDSPQLITDFGRTHNLIASQKLRGAGAKLANALATTEDIVLATDEAFYNALEAQALCPRCRTDRRYPPQTTENQVSQMTQNKLQVPRSI